MKFVFALGTLVASAMANAPQWNEGSYCYLGGPNMGGRNQHLQYQLTKQTTAEDCQNWCLATAQEHPENQGFCCQQNFDYCSLFRSDDLKYLQFNKDYENYDNKHSFVFKNTAGATDFTNPGNAFRYL